MYIYVYVVMDVYVLMYVWMRGCMDVWMNMYGCTCIDEDVQMYVCFAWMYGFMYVCKEPYAWMYVWMHAYVFNMSVWMYLY